MHSIHLEKPQKCCDALGSPPAAKPVRHVFNHTIPSCISPPHAVKTANGYGHHEKRKRPQGDERDRAVWCHLSHLLNNEINRNQTIQTEKEREGHRKRDGKIEQENTQSESKRSEVSGERDLFKSLKMS